MIRIYVSRVLVISTLLLGLLGCSLSKSNQEMQLLEVFPVTEAKTPQGEENAVVAFFWNVELRYIADVQLVEIVKALQDMATLSAAELKEKRYADFYAESNEWTLLQLLNAYFVPESEVSLVQIYEVIERPESRQIVRQTLADIQAYQQDGKQPSESAEPVIGW